MSQQISWNFVVIREFFIHSADFQQISTLEPNFTIKFNKFSGEIFITQSTTHNDSKNIFFIKIHPRKPKICSVLCQETSEIESSHYFFFSGSIFIHFTRFLAQTEHIFGFREWILMKNIFLETLWITLWVIKIYKVKFTQFHCQIWL